MELQTVGHLQCGDESNRKILLGIRKTDKIGNGKLVAPGGNFNRWESPIACVVRETEEEVDVVSDPESVRLFATIDFIHPIGSCSEPHRRVYFFDIFRWTGTPRPREGFDSVDWFPLHDLPYKLMFPDVAIWMPKVLENPGLFMEGRIEYETAEPTVIVKSSFDFRKLETAPTGP